MRRIDTYPRSIMIGTVLTITINIKIDIIVNAKSILNIITLQKIKVKL